MVVRRKQTNTPFIRASLVWNQVAVIVLMVVGGLGIATAGVVKSDWGLVGLGAVVGAVGAIVATLQYFALFRKRK